jgi:UDPglucose 6-dehydrogenase
MNIGIVGGGFVGRAMYDNFFDIFYRDDQQVACHIYDSLPEKSTTSSLEELVNFADVIFVCVPTPSLPDGSCNTKIVEKVVADIADIDRAKLVVIKSTVLPKTSKNLAALHNMDIAFNPEFLTERAAYIDFRYQKLIVIGADTPRAADTLRQLYNTYAGARNYSPTINVVTSDEAETFKYVANCFLATKVIFANQIKLFCDTLDISYNRVTDLALLDPRLGVTHWQAPGPDGKMGYGGTCFPKDMAALSNYASEVGADVSVINAAIAANKNLRD